MNKRYGSLVRVHADVINSELQGRVTLSQKPKSIDIDGISITVWFENDLSAADADDLNSYFNSAGHYVVIDESN